VEKEKRKCIREIFNLLTAKCAFYFPPIFTAGIRQIDWKDL
jgi:hypothetical protein